MNLIPTLKSKLDQLNERERRLVTWGAGFVGLCVLWFALIDPAIDVLSKADQQKSELVNKVAQVKRAALELNALQGTRSKVVLKEEETLPRLTSLLSEGGLAATSSVSRSESGAIEVSLKQAPVAGLLQWLVQAESLSNLVLEDAQLVKEEAGLVSGSIVFNLNASGNTAP